MDPLVILKTDRKWQTQTRTCRMDLLIHTRDVRVAPPQQCKTRLLRMHQQHSLRMRITIPHLDLEPTKATADACPGDYQSQSPTVLVNPTQDEHCPQDQPRIKIGASLV
jgi:hypothetical protein